MWDALLAWEGEPGGGDRLGLDGEHVRESLSLTDDRAQMLYDTPVYRFGVRELLEEAQAIANVEVQTTRTIVKHKLAGSCAHLIGHVMPYVAPRTEAGGRVRDAVLDLLRCMRYTEAGEAIVFAPPRCTLDGGIICGGGSSSDDDDDRKGKDAPPCADCKTLLLLNQVHGQFFRTCEAKRDRALANLAEARAAGGGGEFLRALLETTETLLAARAAGGQDDRRLLDEARAEVERLRRENAQLRRENAVLQETQYMRQETDADDWISM